MSRVCSKKKKAAQVPSIYQQVYFQLREWEQTTTKNPEKWVYCVICDLGLGITVQTDVAAIGKDDAIEQGKARLKSFLHLEEGQHVLWMARKKP